jgi:hypothetical protein
MDTNNKIKKCIKSYLCGRKYIKNDKDKAQDYFNKTLLIYNDICAKNELEEDKKTILNEIYDKTNKYMLVLRDSLFDLIDRGEINKVKKYYDMDDFYIYNEEGFTPMHYAIKNGDTLFLKFAFSLGVEIDTPDKINGHTLLEYACLSGDPNMINFMILNGANIKKHQEFRNSIKYHNNTNQIDYGLIMKYILTNNNKESNEKSLSFIFDYIAPSDKIGLDNITVRDLIMHIEDLLLKIPVIAKQNIIAILKEEIQYELSNNIFCPSNRLEILLYNLIPFMEYPFNLSLRWLIQLEIKYIYYKLKNKEMVLENINNSYINNYLLPNDFIQNLLTEFNQ